MGVSEWMLYAEEVSPHPVIVSLTRAFRRQDRGRDGPSTHERHRREQKGQTLARRTRGFLRCSVKNVQRVTEYQVPGMK